MECIDGGHDFDEKVYEFVGGLHKPFAYLNVPLVALRISQSSEDLQGYSFKRQNHEIQERAGLLGLLLHIGAEAYKPFQGLQNIGIVHLELVVPSP